MTHLDQLDAWMKKRRPPTKPPSSPRRPPPPQEKAKAKEAALVRDQRYRYYQQQVNAEFQKVAGQFPCLTRLWKVLKRELTNRQDMAALDYDHLLRGLQITQAPLQVRQWAQRIIHTALRKSREARGLVPFADPLPWLDHEETVEDWIKRILSVH